jgi:hypothetical protein
MLFSPVLIERFDVSKKRLRTLHINPLQPDEFCISGTDKYDLIYRKILFYLNLLVVLKFGTYETCQI